jgi:hypothetical protein
MNANSCKDTPFGKGGGGGGIIFVEELFRLIPKPVEVTGYIGRGGGKSVVVSGEISSGVVSSITENPAFWADNFDIVAI